MRTIAALRLSINFVLEFIIPAALQLNKKCGYNNNTQLRHMIGLQHDVTAGKSVRVQGICMFVKCQDQLFLFIFTVWFTSLLLYSYLLINKVPEFTIYGTNDFGHMKVVFFRYHVIIVNIIETK